MSSSTEEYTIKPEDMSFFPIVYREINEHWKKQCAMVWVADEVDYSKDRADYEKLSPVAKRVVKNNLCTFAQFDGLVSHNIDTFVEQTSEMKDVRNVYAVQNFIETVHSESYSLMIDAVISDEEEKGKALNSIVEVPAVQKLARWVIGMMDPKVPLLERIVGFACVEGISFCTSFAVIYWLKKQKLMPGTTRANEFISRDENEHLQFAHTLYRVYCREYKKSLSNDQIHAIIKNAVDEVKDFIDASFECDLPNLKIEDLKKYVESTADVIAEGFGAPVIYGSVNPLEWMALISLTVVTNFHEKNPTQYGKADAGSNFGEEEDF